VRDEDRAVGAGGCDQEVIRSDPIALSGVGRDPKSDDRRGSSSFWFWFDLSQ
jgi:hypothetical protein